MTINSQHKSIDKEDQVGSIYDDIFAELDSISAETCPVAKVEAPASPLRNSTIAEAAKAYRPGGKKNEFDYEQYKSRLAEKARLQYRLEKAALGKTVRRYRGGLDAPTDEQRKQERAIAAKAAYESKVSRPVRRYAKLENLTPEQQTEHKRRLASERQRKRRAKLRDDSLPPGFGIF